VGSLFKKRSTTFKFWLISSRLLSDADHRGILAASELNYIVHIKLFAAEQPLPIGLRKSTIVTSGIIF